MMVAVGLSFRPKHKAAAMLLMFVPVINTPRVRASGEKIRYGRTRPEVNRYLKWAFTKAANSVVVNHKRQPDRHVSQRYRMRKQRKGHGKAIVAVVRRGQRPDEYKTTANLDKTLSEMMACI